MNLDDLIIYESKVSTSDESSTIRKDVKEDLLTPGKQPNASCLPYTSSC